VISEASLAHELLAGAATGSSPIRWASIWLEARQAWMRVCTTCWMHFWRSIQTAAENHAEWLIREAGLSLWQRNAVGDHRRVGGGQALAQLLGQELGDADAAAAVGFRGEGFGDASIIGVVEMEAEEQIE